jgi:hypothetical protein
MNGTWRASCGCEAFAAISGATRGKAHTAVKIAAYNHSVVHVLRLRAVGVVGGVW